MSTPIEDIDASLLPERSTETRIGLVMYGGVSLAVYINGVSQEFYHAVQGNGIYRLIKELTDSEIVLDIVSGSSAGGINGILLSYSLANGKDFTRCTDLWRNSADISRLLRAPVNTTEPVYSVLDSEGYYQTELEHAFRTLDGSPAKADSPSPVRELDLFVTGTDIEGRVRQRVDDAGHVLEVKDYRSVFHLKHRQGRKTNFDSRSNSAVTTALAKLARITSCFPGAFAPVFVPFSDITGQDPLRMSANELLQYWGALEQSSFFIDGGVIDNKPFTHTLHEIFFRKAERKVDRKLFYVEPDPERFGSRQPDAIPDTPNFARPIISSLITIPGYESIADDLRLLGDRNDRIREYQRVLHDLSNTYDSMSPGLSEVPLPPEPQRSIYMRARYASICNGALEAVFRNTKIQGSLDAATRRAALIRDFDSRFSGAPETLQNFDVLFRQRRVFHLIYYIYAKLYETSGAPLPEDRRPTYVHLLKRLNDQLDFYNVLTSAMEHLLKKTDFGWNENEDVASATIWNRVSAGLQQLLRRDGLQEHLSDLRVVNSTLHQRIAQCQSMLFAPPNFQSVLRDSDSLESALLQNSLPADDPALRRYFHFEAIDAHLFPLEWVSGVHEKDLIEVFRISPVDAQTGFSQREGRSKTSGDSLKHFSAFFKRTWRSNDIMWGRLDGVCQLVETLLTGTAISSAMEKDYARARAREALLPADGTKSPIETWFADSSEAALARITSWIYRVTDADPNIRLQALSEFDSAESQGQGSIRELLIEMAQFRILHESLPQVFEDSIKEQAEWKQVRKQKLGESAKLEWSGTDVHYNSVALDALSTIGGKKILEELSSGRPIEESPRQSTLGRTFDKFRLGSESVESIPFPVLAEIVLKALLVLRSCIVGSFNRRTADKLRATTLYRWFFDLPLRALYVGVVYYRKHTSAQRAFLYGMTIFSFLALFVGLNWRDAIIQPQGNFDYTWFAIFIVVPLAWISAGAYQISRSQISRDNVADWLRQALITICVSAPLISVILVLFGFTDVLLNWWNGTLDTTDAPTTQFLLILLYVVVPFILSFAGGYMAIQMQYQPLEIADLTAALEGLTDSDLQDVSDRMGEKHRVNTDNRRKIVKALAVAAEMNGSSRRLERAIRAVNSLAFH